MEVVAHDCLGLPRRGQVPRTYFTFAFVTTTPAYRGDTGHLRVTLEDLGNLNGLELWPVRDLGC